MSIDVKYRTSVTANGGHDGRTRTEDGELDLELSTPKELGGSGGEGTNPEQLFASEYAACFLSALKFAAHQLKLHVPTGAAVTAIVGIGPRSESGCRACSHAAAGSCRGCERPVPIWCSTIGCW